MINEAEITEKTGIMYLRDDTHREDAYSFLGSFPVKAVNLVNPTFTFEGTGEDTKPKPYIQPELSASLLPCSLLATTTGSELRDIDFRMVFEAACGNGITDYHVTFECKYLARTGIHTKHLNPVAFPDKNSVAIQAERLREISGLKVESLAEIFKVSRPTYHKWLAGSPPHDEHREHLLEVLALVEEANQRLGSPGATNTWLLTPVSGGGKKPIDYLSEREYSIFRGFLLRVRTGREVFRPLAPSNRVYRERSREEFEDALERLRPRAWIDDERDDDMDAPGTDNEEA
jgi:transcriptional regulator with XRE-family HTH domain